MLQSQATRAVALHASDMPGKLREDSSLFLGGWQKTVMTKYTETESKTMTFASSQLLLKCKNHTHFGY